MPGMSPKIKAKKGRFGAGGVPPTVSITSPASGFQIANGDQPFDLRGTAFDDSGDVSANIAWSSSVDGALGTGKVLSTTLSFGGSPLTQHVITATLNDGTNVVTDTIVVVVLP